MLSSLIDQKGFTQEEVSAATSISKSTISKYINNLTKPKLEYIIAISVALKLSYFHSTELLKRCNIFLYSDDEIIVTYRYFLSECHSCSEITVDWCNEYLKNHSLPLLVPNKNKQDL